MTEQRLKSNLEQAKREIHQRDDKIRLLEGNMRRKEENEEELQKRLHDALEKIGLLENNIKLRGAQNDVDHRAMIEKLSEHVVEQETKNEKLLKEIERLNKESVSEIFS